MIINYRALVKSKFCRSAFLFQLQFCVSGSGLDEESRRVLSLGEGLFHVPVVAPPVLVFPVELHGADDVPSVGIGGELVEPQQPGQVGVHVVV